MKKAYENFTHINGLYRINESSSFVDKLPSGIYDLLFDGQTDTLFFKASEHNSDNIIDLPGTAFDTVVRELVKFLKPETKDAFEEYGFLYKRSSLLYGPPGTGKTCIVNRVTKEVLNKGGIVLFNPDPRLVRRALEEINGLDPDALVMIIFEEIDQLSKSFEGSLLSLLDGEIQKENVVYLATTNYIDQVPTRIKRPGRFSSVIQVGFPGKRARKTFLKSKLKPEDDLEEWVEKTKGLSIDEISECVKSVCCLGYKLDSTIKRLQSNDREEPKDEEYELDIEHDLMVHEMDMKLHHGGVLAKKHINESKN